MREVNRPAAADHYPRLTGLLLALIVVLIHSACRQVPAQSPAGEPVISATTIPTLLPRPAATLPPPQLTTGANKPSEAVPIPTALVESGSIPSPTAAPTQVPLVEQVTLGYSTQKRPIYGWRIGRGPIKMAVVGGEAAGLELASHFQSQAADVPEKLTLWFIPSPNPDKPGYFTNARGINLLHNADTILDSCPSNDWRAGGDPASGGSHPFSEVESQLLRSFLADAWLVIWHGEQMQAGGCGLEQPSQQLAAFLASKMGLIPSDEPLPAGHPVDYLAGRGTAAVTAPLNDNDVDQTIAGIKVAMAQIGEIMAEGPADQTSLHWLDAGSSGIWHFPPDSFIHPLALAFSGQQLYMIDSGRVLRLDLDQPAVPEPLLVAGDEIDGIRVLEPLDLALDGQGLLVLDRAGDVYRLDPSTQRWQVERYDRPVSATSAHYYVALANNGDGVRQLLETDYHLAILFPAGGKDFTWQLHERHQIDISSYGQWSYVLESDVGIPLGQLSRYDSQAGRLDESYEIALGLRQPRQVEATGTMVMVLDQAGRRIVALDPETGQLRATYRLASGQSVSALAIDPDGQQLIVAGPDTLYWWGRPDQQVTVTGSGPVSHVSVHRPERLETLRGLLMPIGGSDLTTRDNQLPGAPRHYRLGVHEGLDVYWTTGTAVRATADGTVIRADWNYTNPTQEQFDAWWSITQSLGYTSPEAQEFYRGRQVWLAHDNGLVSRYVHLSDIGPGVVEGMTVTAGQIVGFVGNSGSPVSLQSDTTDAHLHFELRLGDHYLGQFLRAIEVREWLTVLLR